MTKPTIEEQIAWIEDEIARGNEDHILIKCKAVLATLHAFADERVVRVPKDIADWPQGVSVGRFEHLFRLATKKVEIWDAEREKE